MATEAVAIELKQARAVMCEIDYGDGSWGWWVDFTDPSGKVIARAPLTKVQVARLAAYEASFSERKSEQATDQVATGDSDGELSQGVEPDTK
jgi:hypothetical protein